MTMVGDRSIRTARNDGIGLEAYMMERDLDVGVETAHGLEGAARFRFLTSFEKGAWDIGKGSRWMERHCGAGR